MSKKTRIIAGGIVAAALGLVGLRALVSLISSRPENLGLDDGKLVPCPSYPNCVSTQADDEKHAIAPIPYQGSTEAARERILDIVRSMPRSEIITETHNYVYVEFTTPGFHYTDDVEFYVDEENHVIHFRSAARLPYYDWEVNRKRMEDIRATFESRAD